MKKSIFISFLLASCGSTYIKSDSHNKNDTTFTVIIYSFDWTKNDHRVTTAKRVIKDSFELQRADTTKNGITQKREWEKDTAYLVPIVDSTSSLDSLKRPVKKAELRWVQLPKELLLQDYNKNFK